MEIKDEKKEQKEEEDIGEEDR
ncbi:hypothetical protein Pmani_033842, partial [Petrolisthes manimaculis]